MYSYNNYIARHLVHSTLLITFSLTSIVWLTQALRFIDFIVNKGVSISIFLTLTMLLLPSLLLVILPPAFFCAVLFTYHKLKTDSELVVLRGAGLSNWRLGFPALQVAAVMLAITYAIALYILPVTYRQFREMEYFLRNNYASIFLEEGVFSNPVDGLTVFIRERDKNNILHGILVHDNRADESAVTMMAEEGELVQTESGPRFLLRHGNRQELAKGKLSLLNFDRYNLDISLYTEDATSRTPDPRELFVTDLLTYDNALPERINTKRIAEAHQRLTWPGYVLCLTLVALAVMLGGEFSRRSQWRRNTAAVLCATGIMFSAVALRGITSINEQFIILGYVNLLLPMGIAAWFLTDRSRSTRLMEGAHQP